MISQNLETMAKNLINLKRLWISSTIKSLLPFLLYSKNLKYVVFDSEFYDFECNLYDLNEKRKINGMQYQVQIGLHRDDCSNGLK